MAACSSPAPVRHKNCWLSSIGQKLEMANTLPTLVKVIVVDDNADQANILSTLLYLQGYETMAVSDAKQAVQIIEDQKPDAVILDIGMPDMNGYQIAERIRSRTDLSDILLIALTGHDSEEDRKRSRECGMDHHLIKPVDPMVICMILQSLEAIRELRLPQKDGARLGLA